MRKIEVTLPKRWSDLKRGQLEQVAGYFLKFKGKPEFLTRCFLLFTGWKILRYSRFWGMDPDFFYFKKKGDNYFKVDTDIFTGLAKNLDWISDGFSLTSYVPPINGFQTPNLILYRATLEQYLMADNFYIQFISTGDFRYLDKMIASLYCENISDVNLDKASRKIGRKKQNIRYAVFIWFSGLKVWLRQKYPYIFSGYEDQTTRTPDEAILNLLSALNGGDITKNKTILSTGMHEALFELNQKIEHSKSEKHVYSV